METSSRSYNLDGTVASQSTYATKPGQTTAYQTLTTYYYYNWQDELTKIINPDGTETLYGYDTSGRQTSVETWKVPSSSFSPSAPGSDPGTGDGTKLTHQQTHYNTLGQVDQSTVKQVIDNSTYGIVQTTNYVYDKDGRTIAIGRSDGSWTVNKYDRNGNLLSTCVADGFSSSSVDAMATHLPIR